MARPRFIALVLVLWALSKTLESTGIVMREAMQASSISMATEFRVLDRVAYNVRRMFADILWIRVNDYMHHGVGYKVKTQDPRVPDPRQTATQVGYNYRYNPELIPLMRLVTLLDPTFVMAGTILGMHLINDLDKREEGTRLFHHLMQVNQTHPRRYQIYGELGRALANRSLHSKAVPYLRRAVELFPMLKDREAIREAGERPADSQDDLAYRGYATALVNGAILVEDYELALKTWKTQSDWHNPMNVNFQMLVAYMKQKNAGKVDLEELAMLRREWLLKTRELQKELEKENPGQPFSKLFDGVREQSRIEDKDKPKEKEHDHDHEKKPETMPVVAPVVEQIGIALSEARWKKLGVLLIILIVSIRRGWKVGWLRA